MGKRTPWNKGINYCHLRRSGYKRKAPWNKGLTKEADERVMQFSLNLKYREFTEEHKQKLRLAHLGHSAWNKGLTEETDARVRTMARPRPTETCQKISSANKGQVSWLKGKTYREVYGDKALAIIQKQRRHAKSFNKTEAILDLLLQQNFPNEFKFVGNGKFWIENRCPDFVNINGKKLLIELFGERWHPLQDEQMRKRHFARYGFRTIIIWNKKFRTKADKEAVINEIREALR